MLEWNLERFRLALGAGEYDDGGGGDVKKLKFGGSLEFFDVAVRFIHQTPKGGTVDVRIWKAKPSGEVSVEFGDDLHKLPFKASAIAASSKWAGAALGDDGAFGTDLYHGDVAKLGQAFGGRGFVRLTAERFRFFFVSEDDVHVLAEE